MPVSCKHLLRLHMKFDVQVSCASSLCSFPPPRHAYHFAVSDSSRNRHADFLLLFRDSLPLAYLANMLWYLASADTSRTSARCREITKECIAGFSYLTLAV